jgi:cytochrome c
VWKSIHVQFPHSKRDAPVAGATVRTPAAEEMIMKYLATAIFSAGMVLAFGTACLAQSGASNPGWSLIEAEQIAGRHLFKDHCAACHEERRNPHFDLGPSLKGVVGRRAASVPGFPYSNALKKSGLVWTEDNLRKWIADNEHMVPGMLMPHVAIKDPAEIIYIVEYLKTLKAPEKP